LAFIVDQQTVELRSTGQPGRLSPHRRW